jgi:hypothetical protein
MMIEKRNQLKICIWLFWRFHRQGNLFFYDSFYFYLYFRTKEIFIDSVDETPHLTFNYINKFFTSSFTALRYTKQKLSSSQFQLKQFFFKEKTNFFDWTRQKSNLQNSFFIKNNFLIEFSNNHRCWGICSKFNLLWI